MVDFERDLQGYLSVRPGRDLVWGNALLSILLNV